MASVYTTSRGKNKKAKLGMRKDAANNNANKLQTKITATATTLESLMATSHQPLSLGSSQQRAKTALLKAQSKLALNAANNNETAPTVEDKDGDGQSNASTASSLPLPTVSLERCCAPGCTSVPSSSSKLLLCGGCRAASYCSAECQRRDWPNHKVQCKITVAIKQMSLDTTANNNNT